MSRLLDFEAGVGSAVQYLDLHGDAGTGVYVGGTASGVEVRGCFIGTTRDGSGAASNFDAGVQLTTDGNTVDSNLIADSLHDVRIDGGDENIVRSNRIGLTVSGGAMLGPGNISDGVRVAGATNPQILFNTIGATSIGVYVTGQVAPVTGAEIDDNLIGFNANGDARANDIGVRLAGDVPARWSAATA